MCNILGMSAADGPLQYILSPTAVPDFFRDIWEQRPHMVRHGDPNYFADLLGPEDLVNVVQDAQTHPGRLLLFKNQQQQVDSAPPRHCGAV